MFVISQLPQKGAPMSKIEKKEVAKLKSDIKSDIKSVYENYLSVSGWDVPENDENASARLILDAIKEAVKEIEESL
jgi:uncharacterized protein (UPF0335 family)